jgi:hypothetical protein
VSSPDTGELDGGGARVCLGEAAAACRIREASFDDYQGIAALQRRNGLTPRSYALWSALWLSNPAHCPGAPIGWVIETPGGEIGGYVGNLPLAYWFKDRYLRAATVYSWAADAAFRGYSLALVDRLVRQPGIDLIVCTTPNEPASRVYTAYRFRRIPQGQWDKCWFWITGYRGFARGALRSAGFPWAGALAHPVAAALCVRDGIAGRRLPASGEDFEFADSFDARFDRFWEETIAQKSERLLAVRDGRTLRWHFGPSLAAGDAWILTATRGERLVAYAILDRQDHSALELRRIRFVDFQALDGFEHLLGPALARALEHARAEQAHVLENAGCWLGRWGAAAPYRRSLKTWGFLYKTRQEDLAGELENAAVWAPSAFDGDASL